LTLALAPVNRIVALHALSRRPRDQEPTERGYHDRVLDCSGLKLGHRTARPRARVVDDEVEALAAGIDRRE
jgi:hypothetical protein